MTTSPGPGGAAFDRAYFERVYRSYRAQNPPWKLAFYARVIERFAPRDRPAELLDVGCGLGRFLAAMSGRRGWRLSGTDLSAHAVETCRRKLPAVTVRQASATDRPFGPESFDVVTSFDVIEHVPDRDAAREAIAEMLRPGGLFVFVVPVYDGLSGPIIGRLDRDQTHVHTHGRDEWLRWVDERFERLEWWGILRYLIPPGIYLHVPTKWGRNTTPAILVAARKQSMT